ncbi:MAG TPA: hypothetical protein PLG17_03000 [Thermodesulfobacteriota bacterium]|nr:hypothetical protein [Deltaproteobacteria bacterium]HNR12701.1 hypothetical protein [Thermodesulfobacteriota bacterium]HNU71331.1 hypothetical protein [Thermodesulfobacteriota bacterium]HOC38294.1 hypothetical protein [Thermodesulfobacteriota bacterium]HQO77458.1 hypothetical protein [Thermodesulfobacteriota bacterium]
MKWQWSDGSGHYGVCEVEDEAINELFKFLDFAYRDAWEWIDDTGAVYFYATEEEMKADEDRTHAPRVTRIDNKD